MHLGLILRNIKVGKETYSTQELKEALIDEIVRSSNELGKLEVKITFRMYSIRRGCAGELTRVAYETIAIILKA